MPTRVLIVEDVDSMRHLLEKLLEGISSVECVGSAANTWEARVALRKHRPDVVLLDEVLPGESSLDLLNELVVEKIDVFLLTGMTDPSHPVVSGAQGRLLKPGWQSLEQDRARYQKALETLSRNKS